MKRKPYTRKGLSCKYRHFDKFEKFTKDLLIDEKFTLKIILITQNLAFKGKFVSSNNRMKKFNGLTLNKEWDYNMNVCEYKKFGEPQISYCLFFMSNDLKAPDVIKGMNDLIRGAAQYCYPTSRSKIANKPQLEKRRLLIDILVKDCLASFDEHYMHTELERSNAVTMGEGDIKGDFARSITKEKPAEINKDDRYLSGTGVEHISLLLLERFLEDDSQDISEEGIDNEGN